jgi:hypothetical protein
MRTIDRNAPMSSSKAAVENKPTLAFAERVFSDRLTKKAAIIAKIHRITNTESIDPSMGKTSLVVIFEMVGVNPGSVDQLPFQPG